LIFIRKNIILRYKEAQKYFQLFYKKIKKNLIMKNLPLIFVSFAFLFLACSKKTTTTTNKSDVTKSTTPKVEEIPTPVTPEINPKVYPIFSIRRTACFGKCPSYEAQILSDGTVTYNGKKYTDKEGLYVARYIPSELSNLIAKARNIGYVRMENRYPIDPKNMIADLPYTHTSYNDGKIEKRIANNYDCPPELIEFESMIDEFLDRLQWEIAEKK
jgi:hypothetical protein